MTRRDLFGVGIAAPALLAQQPGAGGDRRTKTAVIVTAYRYYSHADVLVGRLLTGILS